MAFFPFKFGQLWDFTEVTGVNSAGIGLSIREPWQQHSMLAARYRPQ